MDWSKFIFPLSMVGIGIYLIIRDHRRKRKRMPKKPMPSFKDDYEYLQYLYDSLGAAERYVNLDDAWSIDLNRDPAWLAGEIERVEQKIANENIII